MRYEVRCCCTPQKLLGWLEAPEGVREWNWPLSEPMPWNRITQLDQMTLPVNRISLPIAPIFINGRQYLAVKAEGVEIETLRNVVGFIEAKT